MALQEISVNSCHSSATSISFDILKTDIPHDWVILESEDTLQFSGAYPGFKEGGAKCTGVKRPGKI